MDLVSFVPGVGPTAAFTPGASTPAPFNVSHTGLTDGTSPSTASSNMAEIYNRLLLQVASVITKSGLTINNANWAQMSDAVQAIANSAASAALSGYETQAHAAAVYATQASVAALVTMSDANCIAPNISAGNMAGITLPAGGMWVGIWVSFPTGGQASGSSFKAAGGTILGAGFSPMQMVAMRYA